MINNTSKSINSVYSHYKRVNMGYDDEAYNSTADFKNIVTKRIFPLLDLHGTKSPVMVNLGSLKGKWMTEIIDTFNPKKIVCVDLINTFFDHLTKTYETKNLIVDCFTTTGNELSCLKDNSVDGIVSFDALTAGSLGVCLEVEDLIKYIKEFKRVLKPNKKALIHFTGPFGEQTPFGKTYKNLKISHCGDFGFKPDGSQFILFTKGRDAGLL